MTVGPEETRLTPAIEAADSVNADSVVKTPITERTLVQVNCGINVLFFVVFFFILYIVWYDIYGWFLAKYLHITYVYHSWL